MSLVPGRITWYEALARYSMALQRFDHAGAVIGQAHSQRLEGTDLHNTLYALAFLAGDAEGTADQQRWFASNVAYENHGLALEAATEAYMGHLSKARELTRRAVDSAVRAANNEWELRTWRLERSNKRRMEIPETPANQRPRL